MNNMKKFDSYFTSPFKVNGLISRQYVPKVKEELVVDQTSGKLEIGVKESASITDLITLKVYEFPLINSLWLGIVVMVVGFGMSIKQRVGEKSSLKAV